MPGNEDQSKIDSTTKTNTITTNSTEGTGTFEHQGKGQVKTSHETH